MTVRQWQEKLRQDKIKIHHPERPGVTPHQVALWGTVADVAQQVTVLVVAHPWYSQE